MKKRDKRKRMRKKRAAAPGTAVGDGHPFEFGDLGEDLAVSVDPIDDIAWVSADAPEAE